MGNSHQRNQNLPEKLDHRYSEYKKYLSSDDFCDNIVNYQTKGRATLRDSILILAGEISGSFFNKIDDKHISILEVMTGNGHGSEMFEKGLKKKMKDTSYMWKRTELRNFSKQANPKLDIEFKIDASSAVLKYGSTNNILLMISPSPDSAYGDYFAIKYFSYEKFAKYVIIVGELGASDGSVGMYKYMLEHPIWKLKLRQMILKYDDGFYGEVEKEIFIFQKHLPPLSVVKLREKRMKKKPNGGVWKGNWIVKS